MTTKQRPQFSQPNTPSTTTQFLSPSSPLPGKTVSGTGLRANTLPLIVRWLRTLRGQFIMLAVLLFVCSIGMMFFICQQLQVTHDQLDSVAIKSVHSVDAAQRMLQYVEDVDAKSADYIAAAALTDKHPCQVIGTNITEPNPMTYHDCDAINIDAELTLADKDFYLASRNATYPGERTALDRIAAGLSEYYGDVMISRHEYGLARTNFDPKNIHLIMAKNAYYQATDVVNVRITRPPVPDASDETNIPSCTVNVRTPSGIVLQTLPAQVWTRGSLEENVACLTSINKQHLDDAYNQVQGQLGLALVFVSIMSISLCLLLLYTVWRVTRLTHYVIHVTLVLVTLASIVLSTLLMVNFASLYGQQGAFKVMLKDAYNTVYKSEQILQYATAANADESRWLIAVTFNDQDQIDRWQQDWYNNRGEVSTLIKQVQANSTLSEGDKALTSMQLHWTNYITIDPQIRLKAKNTSKPLYNRILDAQALSLGASNDNFFAFSNDVANLSQVNEDYLNSTYSTANSFLTNYIPLCFILFPLVGIFASWSVIRRTGDF